MVSGHSSVGWGPAGAKPGHRSVEWGHFVARDKCAVLVVTRSVILDMGKQEHESDTRSHAGSALIGGRNQTRGVFSDDSEVRAVHRDRFKCGFGSLKCGTGSSWAVPNHCPISEHAGPTEADQCRIGSLKCGTGSVVEVPNHPQSTSTQVREEPIGVESGH